MKIARLVIAGSLLASGFALSAKPASTSAAAPSGQDLIVARQAGMDMSASTLILLKNASSNGAALKTLTFPAAGLAKFAGVMPTLFADSTKSLSSRAKPNVWTDRAGFEAKAAEFATAAKALTAAAAADDKTAFDAALASTGLACKGCHETYQAPPPATKPG